MKHTISTRWLAIPNHVHKYFLHNFHSLWISISKWRFFEFKNDHTGPPLQRLTIVGHISSISFQRMFFRSPFLDSLPTIHHPKLMCPFYCSTIELEIILYKHIHMHKGIWTVLLVRWSSPLLALPFIAICLLGSYNAYGISQLPHPTNHMGLLKP